MAGLRELRKRLKSIRTTGQMAGALRTAATAKYARVSSARNAYQPYREACEHMLEQIGAAAPLGEPTDGAPECIVLLGGNRGFCGGFNTELFIHFAQLLNESETSPMIVICGKKAAVYCHDNNINVTKSFEISDIPTYEEALELSVYLRGLCSRGEVAGVTLVYQKFVNMLIQKPEAHRLFPAQSETATGDTDTLYLPDRDTVLSQMTIKCFDAQVYSVLLENAAGSQAATLMAMRSAYDNAEESAQKLATAINRRRQAEVTASVIETSSENTQ